MRIEDLKEFICLAETLYFSGAARKCFISQSSLSKHISALEKELGFKLFFRNNQQVTLTSAGQVFLEHATAIVEAYDRSIDAVKKYRSDEVEYIHIGYLYGASHNLLIQLSEALLAKNPDLQIRFFRGQGAVLANRFEEGYLDAIINMDTGSYPPSTYGKLSFYTDSYGALVSNEHPLADRSSLQIDDLAGELLLLPSRNIYESSWMFLKKILIESLGDDVHLQDILSDPEELPFYVQMNGAIGLVPQHVERLIDMSEVTFIPIDDSRLNFEVSLVWHKDRMSDSVASLIDVAKKLNFKND